MREPFAKRIIASLEEVLAGMQESGKDQYVNEKKLQTKVNPMGIRNDKEPADVPLDIDQLSYSKNKKPKFLQVPPNQPAVYDANTAENKMAKPKENKDKKYDINRIEQIHSAWEQNKKAKEEEKYDINRVEKVKTTRADEDSEQGIKMALTNLKSMANLTTALIAHLEQGNMECLSEAWVQSKLTLAEDYVSVVHDYVMYKTESDASKDSAYFGNFDGHEGHSKLKKDKSDYEGGNF